MPVVKVNTASDAVFAKRNPILALGEMVFATDLNKLKVGDGSTRYTGLSFLSDTVGAGTVTSVGLSLPGIFSVTGSPVTTSGTLSASLVNQAANTVFAAPNGSLGAPTFRGLVPADLGTGGANGRVLTHNGSGGMSWVTPSSGGLTVGSTGIASGTVGRVLFEGVGNVLQENGNFNFDTTNGLILGGATARATRLTLINNDNLQATKVFVQRNAADSADYTSLRGDGSVDFANISGANNVLVYANGTALIQTRGSAGLRNSYFGLANTITVSGGTVAYNTVVGSECAFVASSGTISGNAAVGFQVNINNAQNCVGIGSFSRFIGANRAVIIGGRSTTSAVRDITGTDVVILGYGTDANAYNYTNSAVLYFNNANASHWLHGNGNIGLFGKKYQILNDSTGTAANRLSTYMDINATNTLTIHTGTATTVNIADAFQMYAAKVSAETVPHFRTDFGSIIKLYQVNSANPYSITNVTTDRSYDASSTTLPELANVVATLIADLKLTGIIL